MKQVRLHVDAGHDVPTIVWLPDASSPAPVVLLGHGGSGHKAAQRHLRMARCLADGHRLASLAIDGPFHGERKEPGDGPLGYQRRVVNAGPARVHELLRDDWLAALRTASRSGLVDASRVGYFGLSMGARYGIPTCAALGERLRCAVVGKFGLLSSGVMQDMAADSVVRRSARAVTAPTLFHTQSDDEVFPRAGQLELFRLLGSSRKALRSQSGTHASHHADDEAIWCDYLTRHL